MPDKQLKTSSSSSAATVLRVALPVPLNREFDYSAAEGLQYCVGQRVLVPFGKRQLSGLITAVNPSQAHQQALKPIQQLLDEDALLSQQYLDLLYWLASYLHQPLGLVIATALPNLLSRGEAANLPHVRHWNTTEQGRKLDLASLQRAPKQAALLQRLITEKNLADHQLRAKGEPAALRALAKKGLISADEQALRTPVSAGQASPPELSQAQQTAVTAVTASFGRFNCFALNGVTGSGKTEVYLQLITTLAKTGQQALVLAPEIGLTPQLVSRFRQRLTHSVVEYHSGMTDRARLNSWLWASTGQAPVIVGTRSAVFMPMLKPGIIIVDEEHDASYKAQDGIRYQARDLAISRAKQLGIPVLLGSATLSLETLHNVQRGRFTQLSLPERAGDAVPPRIRLVDIRAQSLGDGLSAPLIAALDQHLAAGKQALLFLNRRGYAPSLLCHACGWAGRCDHCDAQLVLYQQQQRLRCQHCERQYGVNTRCPDCGSLDLLAGGIGTERVEAALRKRYPQYPLLRIDRDVIKSRQALENSLAAAQSGAAQILLGTQMLAKGHHFPQLTLAAVLDADQGLYSPDPRAAERLAQLFVQVAGRAGREQDAGEVLVQTHAPEHPYLQLLLHEGYAAFAKAALAEREQAQWPPFAHIALIRAEARQLEPLNQLLNSIAYTARQLATEQSLEVLVLGPAPAPMARRAGRHRAQLLFQSNSRPRLQSLLKALVPSIYDLPLANRLRWSLDVDPQDLY